jgi:hypothetical protein
MFRFEAQRLAGLLIFLLVVLFFTLILNGNYLILLLLVVLGRLLGRTAVIGLCIDLVRSIISELLKDVQRGLSDLAICLCWSLCRRFLCFLLNALFTWQSKGS